jgi:hypothetical protein
MLVTTPTWAKNKTSGHVGDNTNMGKTSGHVGDNASMGKKYRTTCTERRLAYLRHVNIFELNFSTDLLHLRRKCYTLNLLILRHLPKRKGLLYKNRPFAMYIC